MSQHKNNTQLSLASVWLVAKINEKGWSVKRYTGPDALLNQEHDVRDVLRAALGKNDIRLTLELYGFVGATGTNHELSLPYDGADGSESTCAHTFFQKNERIQVWWAETDPTSGATMDCFIELSKS